MREPTVAILPHPSTASAVDEARALLARCESGETVEFSTFERRRAGEYDIRGSAVCNRLETAGALLEAAIKRLGANG